MKPLLTGITIGAFTLMALFGLYLMLLPHAAHGECPLMPGMPVSCATLLHHVSHWESSLVSVITALILFGLAAVAVVRNAVPPRAASPPRGTVKRADAPTLFEELLAQGLLHPKIFSA
jgi:hypothetical protein